VNLIHQAPVWLLAVLALLLLAAAAQDAVSLRISNLISAMVLLGAVVAITLQGPSTAVWQNGVIFIAVLILGSFAFGRGWLGGGDVKLLAALGLWVDFDAAILLFASIFVVGGVLALIYVFSKVLAGRSFSAPGQDRRVPYGIAVAAGALTCMVIQAGHVSS